MFGETTDMIQNLRESLNSEMFQTMFWNHFGPLPPPLNTLTFLFVSDSTIAASCSPYLYLHLWTWSPMVGSFSMKSCKPSRAEPHLVASSWFGLNESIKYQQPPFRAAWWCGATAWLEWVASNREEWVWNHHGYKQGWRTSLDTVCDWKGHERTILQVTIGNMHLQTPLRLWRINILLPPHESTCCHLLIFDLVVSVLGPMNLANDEPIALGKSSTCLNSKKTDPCCLPQTSPYAQVGLSVYQKTLTRKTDRTPFLPSHGRVKYVKFLSSPNDRTQQSTIASQAMTSIYRKSWEKHSATWAICNRIYIIRHLVMHIMKIEFQSWF